MNGITRNMAAADRVPASAAAIAWPYVAALATVAFSTVAGTILVPRWGNSAVDLLYVPAVLASAILFGMWPALMASVAAALAYNFFFTSPFHTFRIDRPADIVTVLVLFIVATVTSNLAARVREKAALANAYAIRKATAAGFAARLLSCSGKEEIAVVACTELARIFGCNAAMLEAAPAPQVLASESAAVPISPGDLAVAAAVIETGESAGRGASHPYPTDWQFHAVRSREGIFAAMGLIRDDGAVPLLLDQEQLLASLLDQIALALERARLEREARALATLRERDRVRSALLASIGRDVRPPVEMILAAVKELRRSGSSAKPAAAAIGAEAMKLERYVSNLMELEPDSDQSPIEIKGVTIDLVQRRVSRDGIEVHLTPKEFGVLAELAKHPGRVLTHAHLLRTAWGPAQEGQTEYLRVTIRALRQKLERDPGRPEIIRNEPAVGYRLIG